MRLATTMLSWVPVQRTVGPDRCRHRTYGSSVVRAADRDQAGRGGAFRLRRRGLRLQRASALDFLDLLIRARDLVRDCEPVRASFRRRFKYILVDEFQDTDPLQAELLMLLASDGAGNCVSVRPGALFVVGDPKQSIYRFRRADIGMYRRICDALDATARSRAIAPAPGPAICATVSAGRTAWPGSSPPRCRLAAPARSSSSR